MASQTARAQATRSFKNHYRLYSCFGCLCVFQICFVFLLRLLDVFGRAPAPGGRPRPAGAVGRAPAAARGPAALRAAPPARRAARRPWLLTNGVNTNGAAAKVMNWDRLEKKVRPGTFGKIEVG